MDAEELKKILKTIDPDQPVVKPGADFRELSDSVQRRLAHVPDAMLDFNKELLDADTDEANLD